MSKFSFWKALKLGYIVVPLSGKGLSKVANLAHRKTKIAKGEKTEIHKHSLPIRDKHRTLSALSMSKW